MVAPASSVTNKFTVLIPPAVSSASPPRVELERGRVLARDAREVARGAVDEQFLAGDARCRSEWVNLDGHRHRRAVEEGVNQVVGARVKVSRHRRPDQSHEGCHRSFLPVTSAMAECPGAGRGSLGPFPVRSGNAPGGKPDSWEAECKARRSTFQRASGRASREEYTERAFCGRVRVDPGQQACARGSCPQAAASDGPIKFARGRLAPGDPRNARRLGLGSIKSNLNAAGVERVEGSVAQGHVAKRFQQAAGEIFQAAE